MHITKTLGYIGDSAGIALAFLQRGSRDIARDSVVHDDIQDAGSSSSPPSRNSGTGGKLGCVTIPVLVVLVVGLMLLWNWPHSLMPTYLAFNGNIKVAKVIIQHTHRLHEMSVQLSIIDNDGHHISYNNGQSFLVQGDTLMLQGDVIKFSSWLHIFGLDPGFKLTLLEGRDKACKLTGSNTGVDFPLNGGDDNFFKAVQGQAWLSPVVEAEHDNSVCIPAGDKRKAYNVFMSESGLHFIPVK